MLEITTPTRPPLSIFYRLWFDRIVPVLGRLASAVLAAAARARGGVPDTAIADAYSYLPNSVKRFPGPSALAAEMQRAGLSEIALRDHRRRHRGDPRGYRSRRGGIMSAVSSTATSLPREGVDGLDAIMRRGGEGLRRRMARTERHLERVTARAGDAARLPRQRHRRRRRQATAPAAGRAGRRIGRAVRPRTRTGEERLVRAAVAVELVHSATLVHDDLIDGARCAAAARRSRRRRARDGRRDRRPAVLTRFRRARSQRRCRPAARALAGQLGAG